MTTTLARFVELRREYHASLLGKVLSRDEAGIPTNADRGQRSSIAIAGGIIDRLGAELAGVRLAGQISGSQFEAITCDFLKKSFLLLNHLRPGNWEIRQIAGRGGSPLATFEQYSHLFALMQAASKNVELAAALGNDYTITPDLVILRSPESDEVINQPTLLLDDSVAKRAVLRQSTGGKPILHASISCKWTLRSDRAQNARSEALNLIRNRKGRLPHIVVVTAEPGPTRLASLALGTGDIDCVYHFALHELLESVEEFGSDESKELMLILTEGKRLKDISDLALDLAV